MNEYINVLYIDDYPPDRELVRDALVKEHNHFKLTEAASRIDFEEILKHGSFDIVLSDFNILGFDGLSVIDAVHAKDPSIPVVIVTGTGSEKIAVDAMKRGAYDYVIKSHYHIKRLPATIKATLERKKLEEENIQAHGELHRKKAEQDALLNTIDTHIWYLSDFDTYGMANRAHANFLGHDKNDIEYKRIGEFLPENTIESIRNKNIEVFNSKKEIRTEETLYNHNGERRLFEITRTPKLDENGNIEFVVCTGIDITERREAEEELTKYRNHLEDVIEERTNQLETAQEKLITSERLAVLGRLTGSISHELRNPLAIIDSSAYCLNKTFKDIPNPKAMTYVERIKKQVVRSIAIIQSMFDLTQSKHPQKTLFDLKESVKNAISSIEIPKSIYVMRYLPDERLVISGDKEMIRISIKNIVHNAVQSIQDEGVVTIHVKRSKEAEAAQIIVKDTGYGIPPENLEKIFEPLFSTKTIGIGFGLSISKQVIEMHHGTIEVESKPEKGTKFKITIPLFTDTEQE